MNSDKRGWTRGAKKQKEEKEREKAMNEPGLTCGE